MNRRNLLLMLACLTGVAADTPRRFDDDMLAILRAATEFRPDGSPTAQVERSATKDMAWVRYFIRKDGRDVVTSVLTLKKTSKGWQVESCAR